MKIKVIGEELSLNDLLSNIFGEDDDFEDEELSNEEYSEFRVIVVSKLDMFQPEEVEPYSGEEYDTGYEGWADIKYIKEGKAVCDEINKDTPRTWTFARIEYR